MIHDARVTVTCDGGGCRESIELEPEFKYYDYSGKNGFYDTQDEALETLLEKEAGWTIVNGKHYCPDCSTGDEEETK